MEIPVKLAENIFVACFIDEKTLSSGLMSNNIADVISIGCNIEIPGVNVFKYALPSNELQDYEIPKTRDKIEEICETIKALHNKKRKVIIVCKDGRNQSMLVGGYYLIKYGSMDAKKIVHNIECIHFTKEDQADDTEYNKLVDLAIQSGSNIDFTSANQKYSERQKKKCLTFKSFQKILLNIDKK